MDRRAFLTLTGSALVALPQAARATGGLDIAGPAALHHMRVLLASGGFAPPAAIDAWHFAWNGRTYRGFFEVVALPDGRSGLVNTLPLDAYLYGVVSKEVSPSWAPGAQQAQAIVARTYALGKLRPDRPYDVVPSESDQVYGGIEGEAVEGRAAVDATAGIVLTYAGTPAHVAYSSCCGGRTADAGDVWATPYAYLTSVADPYCPGTPNFEWQAVLPLEAVRKAFGGQLGGIGPLRSVAVDTADPAQRPRGIAFVGATATVETTTAQFRTSLGPGVVRSTFGRQASLGGGNVTVAGTGRGHGVGLCQWGARVMGERGASADEIVAFYFPGTSFGRA